jgi:HK97 family phage major capsid protein|nr:MAG TPA: major capsid protein [Caudoviricetes sp.]
MRRKMNDLMAKRAGLLAEAEAAYKSGDHDAYTAKMTAIGNVNTEINEVKALIDEQDRQFMAKAPDAREEAEKAQERGAALLKGGEVKFSADEVRKAVTLATGTLVEPTGVGSDVRDIIGGAVSSIVDQVSVANLTGMGTYQEPYVISELTANANTVASKAGTSRPASTDPTFGVAEIKPYELTVTSFVDRNLARLTPANYYAKIYNMAMRAMRRKLATLIVNGDGETTHVMYGIKNAVNKAGTPIYSTANVSAVDVNLLDNLYFAYGTDDALAPNARLLLTKSDLKAIGQLRGTNEKQRLFAIEPDMGNPNTGIIRDGGVVIPYTICSDLTSLSGATASTSGAIQTMCYGSPANYLLGLFGDFTIRVDESFKAQERLLTILGDAFVGGNLVADKGFVVATVPKAGS